MSENLTYERHRIEQVWASYNTGVPGLQRSVSRETATRQGVTREISQSWERSSQNVSQSRRTAPVDDPQETLSEWRASLLHAAAAPLLRDIEATAEANDFIVGICDASGKLLWTHTGKHMQKRAEALHFVPGGHWDESSVGTNALALALRRGTPSKVFSAEHYLEAVHDWVCYSAPIRDPASGLALGVLDFSTTWQKHNPLGLMTATALAHYVEARLQLLAPGLGRTSSVRHDPTTLELRLCGSATATLDGTPIKASPRRTEILALLALYPEGLTLDELHGHLYGDEAVSLSTLKAEISGLRKRLGGRLGSRPYRLELDLFFDAAEILRQLEQGDVKTALDLYQGPFLPVSRSPTLAEWRTLLETSLRQASLQRGSADDLWSLVCAAPESSGCDLELLGALQTRLPTSDPRRALVEARTRLVSL